MAESLSICSISMPLHILYISILKDNSFLKYAKQIFAFLCLFSNDKTSHSLYIKKLMTDNIESSRNRLSNPKICLKLIRAPISFSITSHKGFTYLHSNNKCLFGKAEIAAQIHRSQHAGEAKRISKMIGDDEVRWQWETDNLIIMKDLITIKAQQCEQFRNCLLENKDKTLAEATSSKLWATRASPFITRKNFMQLSNICNYQYFIFRWFDCHVQYVGTSEFHFCSPH